MRRSEFHQRPSNNVEYQSIVLLVSNLLLLEFAPRKGIVVRTAVVMRTVDVFGNNHIRDVLHLLFFQPRIDFPLRMVTQESPSVF